MAQGSRFAFLVLTLCLSVFIVGPVPAQAVTLQVNGSGILTGATGVDVAGTLYDVEFVDGTCIAVFTGCDAVSDFTFQTQADANAASQALLDQVLVGTFDTNPALTNGCAGTTHDCTMLTPWSFSSLSVTSVNHSNAGNTNSSGGLGSGSTQNSFDITTRNDLVWAKWNTATAVPEPATITLFSLGLVALILSDYRHRQGRRTGTPLK